MKIWIFAFFFCLLHLSTRLFAEASENSFIRNFITKESLEIQKTSPNNHSTLSDLYASRGESYLILGDDQKALNDFQLSYEYALNCGDEEMFLSFRPLFGAFLVYARLENLESVQEIYGHLETILKKMSCDECKESYSCTNSLYSNGIVRTIAFQDRPIEGPDKIPIGECLQRVENTVAVITPLIAAVKRSEIRVLALIVINGLADAANNCCRAGGLWKGCLQKLVNKFYYWGVFGIPANPAWD